MNFKEIQNKCPKAYFEFKKYHHKDKDGKPLSDKELKDGFYDTMLELNAVILYHDLECFFDSVGIYITIDPRGNSMNIGWFSSIRIFKPLHEQNAGTFTNRTEAKEQALLKAFEILEKQL